MRVMVMGAGGVGGYVGGRLAQAGFEVTLVARGAHLDALRATGLTLDVPEGKVHLPHIRAAATPAEAGEADLVVFAVKMADTDAAAASLAPVMTPRTRILTLQNGIDSKPDIEARTGPGTVAAGVIYIASYLRAPGVIWHPGGFHRIVADRMAGDPVMAALHAAAPQVPGLDIEATDTPDCAIWDKFVRLSAFSGVTSISRSPLGRILETPETRAFFGALLQENVAVARAEGLAYDDISEGVLASLAAQPGEMKSSMLVDLEAGKPIELPWLSGRIVALAEAHGLDVPANRAVVAALAPHVNGAAGGRGQGTVAQRAAGDRA